MTSRSRSSTIIAGELGHILAGWVYVALLLFTFWAWSMVSSQIPENWSFIFSTSTTAVYVFLFLGWLGRRHRNSKNVIGRERETFKKQESSQESNERLSLFRSMLLPVTGYAIPFAVYITVFSAISDGLSWGLFGLFGLLLALTFPFAGAAGLIVYETSRLGQFGPENFKM